MTKESNIVKTKDGFVEKSTGRKIESPLDISTGDVLFSKKSNCKVTIHEITENGIICDWFIGTQHHRKLIQENELLQT